LLNRDSVLSLRSTLLSQLLQLQKGECLLSVMRDDDDLDDVLVFVN
jgi:hypothetical protein